jgi:hypothetical protein
MLTFREFVAEDGVPVVSVNKYWNNIDEVRTRNEINRNLALMVASHTWYSPMEGFDEARKTLEHYGVTLPKTRITNELEGELVIAISQYGDKHGATLDGVVTSYTDGVEHEYYFYFIYDQNEKGLYDCTASILDEDQLGDVLDDDDMDDDDIEE